MSREFGLDERWVLTNLQNRLEDKYQMQKVQIIWTSRRGIFLFIVWVFLSSCGDSISTHEVRGTIAPSQTKVSTDSHTILTPTAIVKLTDEPATQQYTPTSICYDTSDFPKNSRLAFSSGHEGNDEIYILDINDQKLQRITNSPSHDDNPILSHDGSKIAFLSDRAFEGGLMDLYLYVLDDQRLMRVTHDGMVKGPVAWSPDSTEIVYVSAPNGKNYLSVFDVKTGSYKKLPGAKTWIEGPEWSPDGRRIAFLANDSGPNGFSNIFLINRDGTGLVQLTDTGDIHPYRSYSWAPDGSSIIYSAKRNGNFDIFKLDLEAGEEIRMTSDLSIDLFPAWSPNGEYIAYQSADDEYVDIYIMDANGSVIRRLTADPYVDQIPAWSLDGNYIAFVTWGDNWEWSEIRAADANGCAVESLTHDFSKIVRSFTWAP